MELRFSLSMSKSLPFLVLFGKAVEDFYVRAETSWEPFIRSDLLKITLFACKIF